MAFKNPYRTSEPTGVTDQDIKKYKELNKNKNFGQNIFFFDIL